jgi:hypothetical protein
MDRLGGDEEVFDEFRLGARSHVVRVGDIAADHDHDGDLGWLYHTGGHVATQADWSAFLTIAERHFKDRRGEVVSVEPTLLPLPSPASRGEGRFTPAARRNAAPEVGNRGVRGSATTDIASTPGPIPRGPSSPRTPHTCGGSGRPKPAR